jgi:hypothetical protein
MQWSEAIMRTVGIGHWAQTEYRAEGGEEETCKEESVYSKALLEGSRGKL